MSQITEICKKEITVRGELNELVKVRAFVESSASECGIAQHVAQQIALAVDEACSNLVRHAFKLIAGTFMTIKVEAEKGVVVISIFDAATPFNPLQVQSPEMQDYFAQFRRGGLGVQIIKTVMDKIEYFPSSAKQPRNELRLTKNL